MDEDENRARESADQLPKKSGLTVGRMARFAAIGTELTMPPIAGAILGHYLDQHFHTDPIITVAAFFVGLVGGFIRFLQDITLARKALEK